MYTHNVDIGWASGGGNPLSTRVSVEGDGEDNRQLSIPDATTDQLVNLAIDVSQLKVLHIKSDQDVTIKTNNASAPAHTFNITAGVPLIWYEGCGHANPFGSTDVTAVYITNASGETATVNINVLTDSTP